MSSELERSNRRRAGETDRTYYDISMLQAPVWTHEVSAYFFLGGLSAGSYILARLADQLGQGKFRDLSRIGVGVSALAILPCAPLLILDLGDPKRFHHMLRIWKPKSPMNLGSWILTAYTPICLLAALREIVRGRRSSPSPVDTALDVAGIPLALGLAGYTGVLLSTTSTPVWCKNPWLGALFSASALHSGASAISFCLEMRAVFQGSAQEAPSQRVLGKIDLVSTAVEGASLVGFVAYAGKLARPLLEGPNSRIFLQGAVGAGVIVPLVGALTRRPALKVLAAAAALGGAFALRYAVVGAGKPSAEDPQAARDGSRPRAPIE